MESPKEGVYPLIRIGSKAANLFLQKTMASKATLRTSGKECGPKANRDIRGFVPLAGIQILIVNPLGNQRETLYPGEAAAANPGQQESSVAAAGGRLGCFFSLISTWRWTITTENSLQRTTLANPYPKTARFTPMSAKHGHDPEAGWLTHRGGGGSAL